MWIAPTDISSNSVQQQQENSSRDLKGGVEQENKDPAAKPRPMQNLVKHLKLTSFIN